MLLQETQIWQAVAGENQVRFRLDRFRARARFFGARCVAWSSTIEKQTNKKKMITAVEANERKGVIILS